jgi:hypothetical protein
MGNNLKKLRKEAGYRTAEDFVKAFGGDLKLSTYRDHEAGRRSFSVLQAWDYADMLHCSIDELVGREFVPRKAKKLSADSERLVGLYEATDDRGRKQIMDVAELQPREDDPREGAAVSTA